MQKQNWTRIENLENHHKAHKKSKKNSQSPGLLALAAPFSNFFLSFFFLNILTRPPQDSQNILFPCFRLFPG